MNIFKKNGKKFKKEDAYTNTDKEMDLNAKILNRKTDQINWLTMVENGLKSNGNFFEDIKVKIVDVKECFVRWNNGKPDKKFKITQITENIDKYEECFDLIMVDKGEKRYGMTIDKTKFKYCLRPYVKELNDSNMQIYDVMTRLTVKMKNTYKILVFECLGSIGKL